MNTIRIKALSVFAGEVDHERRLALRRLLSRLPRRFSLWNWGLFFGVPLVVLGVKIVGGHPVPGVLDLVLPLALLTGRINAVMEKRQHVVDSTVRLRSVSSERAARLVPAMNEQRQGTVTILNSTRTLREASGRIGAITEAQCALAGRINQAVVELLKAGAVMAMAQDVPGRATGELSEQGVTISKETEENARVGEELGKTVAGFSVK